MSFKVDPKMRSPAVRTNPYRQAKIIETLESLNDGFFALDHDWRCIYVNKRGATNLGLQVGDLIGKYFWEKIPELTRSEHETHYRQAMTEKKPRKFEWYDTFNNNWFSIQVYPSDDGELVYWQDITDFKLIGENLKETQELCRVGSWAYDITKQNITWSAQTYCLYERDPRLGPPTPEESANYYSPEQYQSLRNCVARAIKTGQTASFDLNVKLPSREPAYFHATVHPLKNNRGRITRLYGVVQDITDRWQVETVLKASEEKYRTLFSSLNEGFLILDPVFNAQGKPVDFVLVDANPVWEKASGMKLEDKKGKRLTELLPQIEPVWLEWYRKFLDSEQPQWFETYRSASHRWLNVLAFSLPRNQLAILFVDITQRKNTEEVLVKSKNDLQKKLKERTRELIDYQEKYHSLLDNAMEVVAVAQDGVIKFMNKKGFDMTGYSEEEIINAPLLKLVHPDDREMVGEHYRNRMAGEASPASYEYRMIPKNGFPKWVQSNAVRIIWEGRPAVMAIFNDISERKQAEAEYKESEAKTNALIQYAPTAILEIDFRGPRFIRVNEASCKLTGYTCEELLSLNPLDLLEPPSQSLFIERVKRKLTGEDIDETSDYKVKKKDGSSAYISLQLSFSQKEPNNILAIGHDITRRKMMEKALKTYAQRIIEVQEEERKRIAYELHDDTAQYLSILKMQLNALIESAKIQDPLVLEKLQYLEKDADQAFNNVRRYSHELRPVTLERQGLLAALEQIVEDYNKLGQISIELKVGGKEPKLTEEVKLGLFRIAQESLNNVRKHSKANHASIVITFREFGLTVSVNDDGVGFDVKAANRAGGKGSLGLMSMRERADLIDAKLKIDSKPGRGTTIIVDSHL
jgi:PAS domain S-box-containing protein